MIYSLYFGFLPLCGLIIPITSFSFTNNLQHSQSWVNILWQSNMAHWLPLKLIPINTHELLRQTRGSETVFFLPFPPKQAEIIKHLSSEKRCSHWKVVWFKDLLSGLTRQGLSIWFSRFYISNKALIAKVTDHLIKPDNKSALSVR